MIPGGEIAGKEGEVGIASDRDGVWAAGRDEVG